MGKLSVEPNAKFDLALGSTLQYTENMNEFLEVKINDYKQGLIFEGKVRSLTANNDTGMFTILPEHANYITLINGNIITRGENKQTKTYEISKGILECKNNKIIILISMESKKEESI